MADGIHIQIDDPQLLKRLSERADRHGRSVSEEAQLILEASLIATTRQEFAEAARRIGAMTPNVPQTPAENLVREGRAER